VTTNVIITPDQRLDKCAESPSKHSFCDLTSNNCTQGHRTPLGAGIQTGHCVWSPTMTNRRVCEIKGWCPVELDELPLRNQTALLGETKHFTVMIKNSINFEQFNVQRRNIENTLRDQLYLKTCHYHPINDPRCPIFRLGDIVHYAGENYDEMAKLGTSVRSVVRTLHLLQLICFICSSSGSGSGGVIEIQIKWECNLDFDSVEACFPRYSFERLDIRDALISPGLNFRYARYKDYDKRTMYKVYGIK
jgi:hypothetical protein